MVKKNINTLLVTCAMTVPKTSAHVKSCHEQTKWMQFLFEDSDLLEKQNTVWDKTSADTKKEFDSKPVYQKFFLKAEIKSYCDEVVYFYDK